MTMPLNSHLKSFFKVLTLLFLMILPQAKSWGQTTIFTETMGTVSGTTAIATHETANGFDNDGYTMSGTGDLRITTVSTGYTGASGSANVFLTNTAGKNFQIAGINTSGYSSITLSFGVLSSVGNNMLTVEYSTDGSAYTALTVNSTITVNTWTLKTASGTIPASATLYLRWTQPGTTSQFRIDDVTLTGTLSGPTLTLSTSTFTGFTYVQGAGPSASQTYNLSGVNLTGFPSNITVTGSANYEVSTDNSTFAASVNVAYSSATLASTPIYIRLKSGLTAANYNNEVIANAGGGATTVNVTCSGSVTAPTPVITVSSSTLTGFTYIQGSGPSASQSYNLSAVNLTGAPGNLTVTGSTNYEVSTNNSTFAASVTVAYATSTLSATPIYVRLKSGLTVGNYNSETISNAGGGATTVNVTCSGNVTAAPSITSSLTSSGTVDEAYSYSITASNTPTSYNATGLPAGLSVNTSTGVISGTPTGTGTSNVTISATNASGTGTATLVITISNPPAPAITSSLTASGSVNNSFSYTITASNTPTSYNATGLPAGLSINTTTGVISGTPTAIATTSVTISATNAGGTGTATLVITISSTPVPVITSSLVASGIVTAPFTYTITATNTPTSYNATGLPAGLSINTTTGVISGTPTAAATSNVTISATNSGGTVSATLVITTSTYANGDYRTIGSGSWVSNNATPAIWQKMVSGAWAASNSPTYATTANIYIQSGHTITTGGSFGNTVNLMILSGGIFDSNHQSTTGSIKVYGGGTLNINAALTNNGNFEIEDNGNVNLNYTDAVSTSLTTKLWNGTEIFRSNSIFTILDLPSLSTFNFVANNTDVSTNTSGGYSAMFGYLIVDMSASANTSSFSMFGTGITNNLTHKDFIFRTAPASGLTYRISATGTINMGIGRDFITESTFTSTINNTTTGNVTLNIAGNLNHGDGNLLRVITTASTTAGIGGAFNIDGNLNITNNSTLHMNATSGSTTAASVINLKGDLTVDAGSLLDNANTVLTNTQFNFTGTGDGTTSALTQEVDIASTGANENRNIPFTISSGAYVEIINQDWELGTASSVTVADGGTLDFGFNGTTALLVKDVPAAPATRPSFNLNAGGTLKITSTDGVTTTAGTGATIGNVQVLNTNRTFNQDATYWYIGKANQVVGNAIGSTGIRNLTIETNTNTLTVTMNVNNIDVGTNLTLTSGVLVTNGYRLTTTNTTASNLIHTTGNASFVYATSAGIFRRHIASNTSTYELPIGDGIATTNYKRADVINNNLTGVNYIDTYVSTITEAGNNIDSRLVTANMTQNGVALNDIVADAEWSLVPDAITGGSYGVNLYIGNLGGLSDNAFCAVKRTDASSDYADWNTFASTTTIPATGSAGRILSGGAGYAQRLGYTAFSKHAVAKAPSVLPVKLISFIVTKANSRMAVLNWQTSTEINNDYFEVERSRDGADFSPIGKVNGSGTTNQKHSYNLTDSKPFAGINYYRLKQTDYDGKYEYSDIKTVQFNDVIKRDVFLPENQLLEINNIEGVYSISVMDALGKTLVRKEVGGYQTIDFSGYSTGVYFVRLQEASGQTHQLKLVK